MDSDGCDPVEGTLFNGLLAGMSLDGERLLHVNPLQVSDRHTETRGDHSARPTRRFTCACCPPDVMRPLGSPEHCAASTDSDGLQIHQHADGRFVGAGDGDTHVVSVHTNYPDEGTVRVTVKEAPAGRSWTHSLRVPQWCDTFQVRVAGRAVPDAEVHSGRHRAAERTVTDRVPLGLTQPHPPAQLKVFDSPHHRGRLPAPGQQVRTLAPPSVPNTHVEEHHSCTSEHCTPAQDAGAGSAFSPSPSPPSARC
jgi:DUF1680 family protein